MVESTAALKALQPPNRHLAERFLEPFGDLSFCQPRPWTRTRLLNQWIVITKPRQVSNWAYVSMRIDVLQ
jgi:hypothetical protein